MWSTTFLKRYFLLLNLIRDLKCHWFKLRPFVIHLVPSTLFFPPKWNLWNLDSKCEITMLFDFCVWHRYSPPLKNVLPLKSVLFVITSTLNCHCNFNFLKLTFESFQNTPVSRPNMPDQGQPQQWARPMMGNQDGKFKLKYFFSFFRNKICDFTLFSKLSLQC